MRRAILRAWPGICLAWAICLSAEATPLPLSNGDFEDPSMSTPNISSTIPNWSEWEDAGPNSSTGTIYPAAGTGMPGAYPADSVPEGSHSWGYIRLLNRPHSVGAIWQSIGTITAETTYRFSFDVENPDSLNGSPTAHDIRDHDTTIMVAFFIDAATPDFNGINGLDLSGPTSPLSLSPAPTFTGSAPSFWGKTAVGEFYITRLDDLNRDGTRDVMLLNGQPAYDANFFVEDEEIEFTPTAGQVGHTLQVVFFAERTDVNPSGSSMLSEVWFDGAIAETTPAVPTPEPSSIALAVLGSMGLVFVKGRRWIRRK